MRRILSGLVFITLTAVFGAVVEELLRPYLRPAIERAGDAILSLIPILADASIALPNFSFTFPRFIEAPTDTGLQLSFLMIFSVSFFGALILSLIRKKSQGPLVSAYEALISSMSITLGVVTIWAAFSKDVMDLIPLNTMLALVGVAALASGVARAWLGKEVPK